MVTAHPSPYCGLHYPTIARGTQMRGVECLTKQGSILTFFAQDAAGEKEKGTEGKSLRYVSANKNEVPWDAVRLSVGLLLAGLVLLVLGGLHLSRHIVGKDGAVSMPARQFACMLHAP